MGMFLSVTVLTERGGWSWSNVGFCHQKAVASLLITGGKQMVGEQRGEWANCFCGPRLSQSLRWENRHMFVLWLFFSWVIHSFSRNSLSLCIYYLSNIGWAIRCIKKTKVSLSPPTLAQENRSNKAITLKKNDRRRFLLIWLLKS